MSVLIGVLRALYGSQLAIDGEPIRYSRGTQEVELIAARGKTVREDYGTEGVTILGQSTDWLHIFPEELVLDGEVTKPLQGDKIRTSRGECFTVGFEAGEDVFDWMDKHRVAMRIHSQETKLPVSVNP